MKTVQGIADDVANYQKFSLWRVNRERKRKQRMLAAFLLCAFSGGLVGFLLAWTLR